MLSNQALKAFLPISDPVRALAFYRDTLGLTLISQDDYALLFKVGDTFLRITPVGAFQAHPFTVLGWEVQGIEAEIRSLVEKGVVFERFSFLPQDELGIWTAPGGTKVAWFKDPDGNILSLDEFQG